jgi:hypothetical protein
MRVREIVLVVLLWSAGLTAASESSALSERFFDEHFDPTVLTDTHEIVGLELGALRGSASLHQLMFSLPARKGAGVICLSGNSKDGQYWLRAEFNVSGGDAYRTTIGHLSKYEEVLKRYAAEDLALVAQWKASCEDLRPGYLLPVDVDAGNSRVLHVMVNSQRAASVEAELSGASGVAIAHAHCTQPGGEYRAYDSVCTMLVPPDSSSGLETLRIHMLSRTGRLHTISALVSVSTAAP